MKPRMAVCAIGALITLSGANGQTGVLYRLEPGSTLTSEFCLDPCLCPMGPVTGPVGGTFVLTLDFVSPMYTHYTISGADWVASYSLAATFVRGSGTYRIGGEVALSHEMNLRMTVSTSSEEFDFHSGVVPVDPQNPFPRIGITVPSDQHGCTRYTVHVVAKPVQCQTDCDASGVLTANDFQCFLNKFASGDPYANCDGSTGTPRLTANDFQCYLNHYAAGCP